MRRPKGIIAAMVTPMTEDENIDLKGLEMLTDRLINAGVHGLFCLGTNGEFYALTQEEKEDVVKTVVAASGGRVPVFAGTGGITAREVISLTRRIQGLGVEAVSVVTPYFVTPGQEELYRHYKSIAEAVDIPVLLYNIPARTGVHLETDTVARLSEIPGIIGIKDSSGKLENIRDYIRKSADGFCVLAGNDNLIYDALEAGGKGAIAATANVVPELVVSIYENYKNGRPDLAKAAQAKLGPLRDAAFKLGTVPGVIKEAARRMGMPAGISRMPVSGLTGSAAEELERVLKNYYGEYMG